MVDLCCGSGSGLVAAVRLGHAAAGFDISERQVDASKGRLQQLSRREVILSQPWQLSYKYYQQVVLRTSMFAAHTQNMLSSLQLHRIVNKGFCEHTCSEPILKPVKHKHGTLRTHMFTGLAQKTLFSLQSGPHMFNRGTYMQMRAHSEYKKAPKEVSQETHIAEEAPADSIPDSPAGSQSDDSPPGSQNHDPEYQQGDDDREAEDEVDDEEGDSEEGDDDEEGSPVDSVWGD